MVFTTIDPSLTPTVSQNINNILDNGGFEVWQRGTTFNGAVNAQYTADRWKNSYGGTPTVNMTQESTIVHDGGFSLKVVITASPSGLWSIVQQVENYSAYRGKTMTFSCWLNTTMTNCNLVIYDGFTLTSSAFHPGDGQWHQLSVTATMSASATALDVFISQETLGVTGTLYVDSAMLTIGSNVVTFVPTGPQQDLARCQRFYNTSVAYGQAYGNFGTGYYDGTTTALRLHVFFPVTMRIAPSITQANLQITSQGGTNTGWTNATSTPQQDGFLLQITHTGNVVTPNNYNWSVDWTASADF